MNAAPPATPRDCIGVFDSGVGGLSVLAALNEEGDLDAPALRAAVGEHTAPLRAAGVDTVVLGCTHYRFVRHLVEAALGRGVQVVDTADAVARHAASRFASFVRHDGPAST